MLRVRTCRLLEVKSAGHKRAANSFWIFSKTLKAAPRRRNSPLSPWLLPTSKSTELLSNDEDPTELMVINPYLSSPSHIEMILTEQDVPVPRPKAAKSKTAKLAQ